MPIPEFNQIKAPALQFFSDGQPHHVTEVYDALVKHFQLTEADLSERLPSGTQSRWHNRANWACARSGQGFCLSYAVLGRSRVKLLACTNEPSPQPDSRFLFPRIGFAEA